MDKQQAYEIDSHTHRFAAWAASRAAGRGVGGFNISLGTFLLEECGAAVFQNADFLPAAEEIDVHHYAWCEKARRTAADRGVGLSHGIAAKLVNVYHKSRFVCAGYHHHPKVVALHPPIDSILLRSLAARKIISNQRPWSQFSAGLYQNVIDHIREHLGGKPMWMIEEFWDPAVQKLTLLNATIDK